MAIKPTIYKFRINLSDIDRSLFQDFALTVALHPSETVERMMARVLVYCIHWQEELTFSKGLSDVDEPDIWLRRDDSTIAKWIELGEPSVERIKKASRQADQVTVYSFNRKSPTWWASHRAKFNAIKADYYQLQWDSVVQMAAMLRRSMELSITLSGNSAYVASDHQQCEVGFIELD